MNRRLLLRGFLAKEVRTLIRDRQQILGLAVFALSMGFLAYLMQATPAASAFLMYPQIALLGAAAGLSSFVSFMAVPLALAAFVGEKEESTLEVLLAAPIPDRMLYLLKCLGIVLPMAGVGYTFLGAGVLYGLLAHQALLAGLGPGRFAATVLLSLPFPMLFTALQVGLAGSISVWADTKKGAEQLFGAVMVAGLFGGALVALLLAKSPLRQPLLRFGVWWLAQPFAFQYGSLIGLLALLAAVLLSAGAALFKRERLVT
jgi:hypothetical protein